MKNLILIVIGVCMMAFSTHAQDGERFSIGVSAGTGIPVGLWGKKDIENGKATGFTQRGKAYNLSLTYKLGKGNYGLTSLIGRQINTVDTKAYADAYSRINEGGDYKVESDDWRVNQFMLGGFVTKPLSQKLDIDLRVLAGVVHAGRPATDIFDGDFNYSTSTGTYSTSFAYTLGTGIKYHIGKRLDLLVNVDYLNAKPEFDVDTGVNGDSSGNSIFSQNINSINLSVGIAVKL